MLCIRGAQDEKATGTGGLLYLSEEIQAISRYGLHAVYLMTVSFPLKSVDSTYQR